MGYKLLQLFCWCNNQVKKHEKQKIKTYELLKLLSRFVLVVTDEIEMFVRGFVS